MNHIFLTVTVLCRSTFGPIAYLTCLFLGKLFDVYDRERICIGRSWLCQAELELVGYVKLAKPFQTRLWTGGSPKT